MSTAALAVALFAGRADAGENRPAMVDRALTTHVNKHKLQDHVRTVKLPKGRTLKFLPVLPNTEADFLASCDSCKTVLWRHREADPVHANLILGPTDHVGYTKPVHNDHSQFINAKNPGKYLVMALEPAHVQHMVKRFELVGTDPMHHREKGKQIVGQTIGREGCMWWLVHAETAPGVNLATTLGVHRSMAPENLVRKLLHQGNERVSWVGVAAQTLEQYKGMTDDQLVGPAPLKNNKPQ